MDEGDSSSISVSFPGETDGSMRALRLQEAARTADNVNKQIIGKIVDRGRVPPGGCPKRVVSQSLHFLRCIVLRI